MTANRSVEDDPAFRISVDIRLKLLSIEMRGFWTPIGLDRFDRVVRAALHKMHVGGCPIKDQVTLFDATNYGIQSQPVVAGLAAIAADQSIEARKTAVVLGSTLLKMQAIRAAPNYGVFTNRPDALAWLLAAD